MCVVYVLANMNTHHQVCMSSKCSSNGNTTKEASPHTNVAPGSTQQRGYSPPPSGRAPSRSRSRSPSDVADGCSNGLHCERCASSAASEHLKPSERENGCCGHAVCCTSEPAFYGAVLGPVALRDASTSAGSWRFAAYRNAFRYIHGIGRRGEQVAHGTCVLAEINLLVLSHHSFALVRKRKSA